MIIFIKKILEILSQKDKKKVFLSVIFLLVRSALEVLSVGLLIPILNFISNQSQQDLINGYFPFLSKLDDKKSIIFFVSIFIIIYFIKTVFMIFYNSWNSRFVNNLSTNLAHRVLDRYLSKDYIFFLENNSALLIRNISSETAIFSQGLIGNIILCVTQLFFIFSICLFLILYNIYSLYVILILAFFCILIIGLSNKKFSQWGIVRQEEAALFLKKINEVIGSIKEIILYNKKYFFLNEVSVHSKKISNSNIYRDTAISFASPIIEFTGILIFFIYLLFLIIYSLMSFNEIIVLFGIFVFASLKILPALISFIRSFQSAKFNLPACEVIYQILKKTNDFDNLNELKLNNKINLNYIEFKKVSFIYPLQKFSTFNNLNFKIEKGDSVALIGETGSGKTTLLNLISTLIAPTGGEISVNNFDKLDNLKEIRKNIGYVSQSVYLSDNSILFNIALTNSVSQGEITKIMTILESLNLNVINKESVNINSSIGERGSRLSGGQIQRIGIARALFRDPDILILDEATNALDKDNEEKICSFLTKEFKQKIIIFCTHKKEILKYCNKIIEVKNNTVSIKENNII